ncbi:MAG: UDP-N-acetylmuramoyl-tripeptide--D-alanyl-D-alanine ligase, partial [Solirubrobacteraceae bacterium]|nr:UDP-N-acetylmuramoyl-tripeptide--D-alanyl-D-alanine ligase [Solirubrobacteraceae bacterium]
MIELTASQIADALGAADPGGGDDHPIRVVIDSREAGPGDLFIGIRGERVDGGTYAQAVIDQGAWGVVVTAEHAAAAGANVFVVDDPTAALGTLANRWRHVLGAKVIGVTGSTGKTSTKDILTALLGKSMNVVATPANRNTEIGLPLTVLSAPMGTDALVLEMAMRGPDQIDELARIAEPDVGCIVNVGPVHLEQLGSLEGVARAKAELIAALGPGTTAVVPVDEPLLTPHIRDDVTTVSFGPNGDVRLLNDDAADELRIATRQGEIRIRPSFKERYLTRNLLAAVACAQAVGA